ncbi:sulfotransferase family protein [Amycolatopsis taiwanensis]|uniref:Sulfotransferase n=1 Tax=Amycolatopsis taiwanensis TaxID=342230 RepID=A0A9W6VK35_9PSEU|nr:sulfotransferase [Amycolatopsis taiwanensis]GLY71285.1 sulfotransferase [Amycolatopsis taiwanensis]
MTSTKHVVGTIDELHDLASGRTGLTDFGEDDYRDGLAVLLDSYANDAALTPKGVDWFRAMLVTVLESRLYTRQSWQQHPEYAGVPIERPVFVTGLPRTGTTALHRLLCVDPAHQGLEHWLTETPQPRPPRETWPENPGYQRMRTWVEARYAGDPDFKGVHFMAPEMVEECWRVERQSMRSIAFPNTAHLPAYSQWLASQDMLPVYRLHRRVLQVIGLNDIDRRWVLKHPGHLFALDALMAVYPDALVIQTHRDPRTIIASVCSLNQKASEGNSEIYRGEVLGRDLLELWATGAKAFAEARKRYDPAQFVDVYYDDFVTDAVGTVESIYQAFGLVLDEATRAAIADSHGESKTSERRPVHRYRLGDFGLSEHEVAERFAGYLSAHPAVLR